MRIIINNKEVIFSISKILKYMNSLEILAIHDQFKEIVEKLLERIC